MKNGVRWFDDADAGHADRGIRQNEIGNTITLESRFILVK